MPFVGGKFSTFADFARADLPAIYTPETLAGVRSFESANLNCAVLINLGDARFEVRPLRRLAQASPGSGIVAADFDADSHLDVCIAQNSFSPQPETGRMDGGLSILLSGSGDGDLTPISPATSGLVVPGDSKGLTVCDLNRDGWPDLAMTQNDGPLLAFVNTAGSARRSLAVRLRGKPGNPTAVGARVSVVDSDGGRQTSEVYCGSGYLSQSTCWLFFGLAEEARPWQIIVEWPDGRESSHAIDLAKARITIAHPGDS